MINVLKAIANEYTKDRRTQYEGYCRLLVSYDPDREADEKRLAGYMKTFNRSANQAREDLDLIRRIDALYGQMKTIKKTEAALQLRKLVKAHPIKCRIVRETRERKDLKDAIRIKR